MRRLTAMAALVALASGCSGAGGTGAAQIFVVPEDTITVGLEPGTGPEDIQDGWAVSYSRYLVTVGNFRARRSDTGETVGDPTVYVLDMKHAPTSGYVVTELDGIAAARWDKFGYDVPNASEGAETLAPTEPEDVALMIDNGYSVYYEGTASKEGEEIAFAWGFSAGTSFDDCASSDGIPGFAVPSGGTVQVKPTIHGDHQLFDNVTQGVELTQRLAGWMQLCDADGDRGLTMAELHECDVTLAMPTPPYDLSGVRDQDDDGWISVFDVVDTEMRTFGDFQGDGECPTRTPLP
jgi:hypothetical protein